MSVTTVTVGPKYEMCLKAVGRRHSRCTLPKGHSGGHGVMCFRSIDERRRLEAEYRRAAT